MSYNKSRNSVAIQLLLVVKERLKSIMNLEHDKLEMMLLNIVEHEYEQACK